MHSMTKFWERPCNMAGEERWWSADISTAAAILSNQADAAGSSKIYLSCLKLKKKVSNRKVNILVWYLLIIIYRATGVPTQRAPGYLFGSSTDFCATSPYIPGPDLAASNRCPFEAHRRPAINAFRCRRRRLQAFPGWWHPYGCQHFPMIMRIQNQRMII